MDLAVIISISVLQWLVQYLISWLYWRKPEDHYLNCNAMLSHPEHILTFSRTRRGSLPAVSNISIKTVTVYWFSKWGQASPYIDHIELCICSVEVLLLTVGAIWLSISSVNVSITSYTTVKLTMLHVSCNIIGVQYNLHTYGIIILKFHEQNCLAFVTYFSPSPSKKIDCHEKQWMSFWTMVRL